MQKLHNKVKLHFKLPIFYNDGTPVESQKLANAKNYFIETYGGLTVDGESEGYWKDDGVLFKDHMMEYSVFIPQNKFNKVRNTIPKQITRFRKEFEQIEIFCYYHNVIAT
ncbi:MAG: hypothetical protein KGI33_11855 [Thaumarchaeota archaeon]|nr:hypothetical protein [Nitrososphaerota archaeon]